MNAGEGLCEHRAVKFPYRRKRLNLWRIDTLIMAGGVAEGVFAMDSRLRGNDKGKIEIITAIILYPYLEN